MLIKLTRVYALKTKDCPRILVDRLWPRGMSKERLQMDFWAKELTPTSELRQKYHKGIFDWKAFKSQYIIELKNNTLAIDTFVENYEDCQEIELVYAAKNEEQNHAIVLRDFLLTRFP